MEIRHLGPLREFVFIKPKGFPEIPLAEVRVPINLRLGTGNVEIIDPL